LVLFGISFLTDKPTDKFKEQIEREKKPIEAVLVYPTLPPSKPTETQKTEVNVSEPEPQTEIVQQEPIPQEELPEVSEQPTDVNIGAQDSSNQVAETVRQAQPKTTPSLITGSSTKQFLQRQFESELQNLSETESEQYRQSITSPELNIPDWQNIEEEPVVKPVTVRCDNTAAKTVRLLGNIMGGRMRCADKPDIDQFIQKRLNKNQSGEKD
jgi:hypothetical protein